MDKLHVKFSALNVHFSSPKYRFLGSRKPALEGIKEWYPCKSHYFTVVGQLRDTFQEQIVPKTTDIDMEKLNVHFGGPNLDFLGSRMSLEH